MKRFRAPLLVGLAGVVGVVVFVFLFGTVQKSVVAKGEGYRVVADFEDVSGLAGYSRVTVAGFPIGTIEGISLVAGPAGQPKARVTMRLRDDIVLRRGLPQAGGGTLNGAVITRRTATMLGDYYLEITPGVAGDVMRDGDAIPNVVGESGLMAIAAKLENASDIFPRMRQIADDVAVITHAASEVFGGVDGKNRLERIAADAGKAADDIARMTAEVRGFVGRAVGPDGTGRVDRILGNVERFTADAARFSHDAARFTRDSGQSLSAVVDNLQAITSELRRELGSSGAASADSGTLGRLHASLENLELATRHLNSIVQKVDEGKGTVGKLINDDKIATKTEQIVTDVSDMVSSVTRLQTKVEFRSEFNIQQRALKNYLALKFQPDRSKYYLVEVVFDPRGKTSTTERLTLTNDPSLPPALSERVTETSSQVKFGIQFAKRFGFFTGRFGLIESTGGLGFDLEFFKDSLKLTTDLFDFNADQYPRLRFLWSYTFLEHFTVLAGIDDVMNKAGRDYFVGAGFRFTDDDLKSVLLVAPKPSL